MASNKRKKNSARKPSLAAKADRYSLYERSVQCVEAEIDFVDSTFFKLRARSASRLREDFCGTANVACEWVKRRSTNIAYGVDIDPEILAWCKKNKLSALKRDRARRVNILNYDVLTADTGPVDIVLAMNFSYWVFKDRSGLLRYFEMARDTLVDDGILFLDAYGGYEAFQELKEKTQYDDFTYIWDQHSYNPINGHAVCKIHFKFKDGSKIKNAFEYNWRIWTLPEITELLAEVGLKPSIYWEGADENGEGNGVYTETTVGEADAGWVAYIIAVK